MRIMSSTLVKALFSGERKREREDVSNSRRDYPKYLLSSYLAIGIDEKCSTEKLHEKVQAAKRMKFTI